MAIKFVTSQAQIDGSDDIFECISFDEFIHQSSNLSGFIGIDTETGGFNPYNKKLLSLQIGNFDTQYVLDYQFITKDALHYLKTFFKRPDLEFGMHNAKFDLRFLMLQDLWPANVYDSYLVETILHLGLSYEKNPKSLADVAKKYAGVQLDKSIRGHIHWQGLSPSVIKYAADDVKYLEIIRNAQMAAIKELELDTVVTLEHKFVKVLAYIEMCGLRIDIDKWNKRIKEDEKLLLEKLEDLNDYILVNSTMFPKYVNNQLDLFTDGTSCNINWNSPKQVTEFFKGLGLNLLVKDKKTGKMKYSVDAKVLTPQKNINPVIEIYLDYKGQEKVISTYGQNWLDQINPVTGRLHTQFKQMIDTARLSSGGKDSKTKINYINFLNIPQDNAIRNCIIPKEGYSFIDCDYAGQESVVLANKSMEKNLIDFYNKDGGDLHSFVASKIYPECADVPLNEIKDKFKKQRQEAKAANFAIAYGGVGATIANNLSISIEEGDKVYNAYMNAFPQLKQYFKKVQNETHSRGYILTNNVTKRRIFIDSFEEYKELAKKFTPDFWENYKTDKTEKDKVRTYFKIKGDIDRMALNYPIQSTGADISKLACIYVYEAIESRDAFFKILFPNFIHDQIILEVPDEETSEWANIVQSSMEKAGSFFCKTVKLKAEPEILKIWKK